MKLNRKNRYIIKGDLGVAILETEVWVGIGGNNVGHYESLGYEIPRRRRSKKDPKNKLAVPRGTKILVKVEDLPKVSTVKITKVCDYCGKQVQNQEYGTVISRREERDGTDRCFKCGKINGGTTRKNTFPLENSLENYAIENNMEYLLKEFSDKNNKQPKDISYGTEDSYLWNCQKCESEYDMKVHVRTYSKCNCPYCSGSRVNETNCLWTTNPNIAKLLKNTQRGYELTVRSNKREKFICNDCGYSETKRVNDVFRQGFSCPRCSDGFSYPEKFVFSMLSQLNIETERQKTFEWSNINSENKRLNGSKKYDFYIPHLNTIIETHGQQHYDLKFNLSVSSLIDEKNNDIMKEKLAKQNNIDNYIIINCSKSDPNFIKNNIIKSKINEMLFLKNVDWDQCHRYAMSSLVKSICLLWDDYKSVTELSKSIKMDKTTVRRYLKQGAKVGFCNYNGEEEAKKTRANNLSKIREIRSVKIIQMTKQGEFIKEWNSVSDAQKTLEINNITTVCRGRQSTAGGFKWMYKEDYDQELNKNK